MKSNTKSNGKRKSNVIAALIIGLIIATGCKIFGASGLVVWCSYWVGAIASDFYLLLKRHFNEQTKQ